MEILNLKKLNSTIIIGDSILEQAIQNFAKEKKHQKIFIVSDENVAKFYLSKVREIFKSHFSCQPQTLVLPCGEKIKHFKYLNQVYDFLITNSANRSSLLVALGGGVIGDLVGYAAASFMRGIDLIQIPTSLLAQADSSIGGKTGINHEQAKNIIGAFKQPLLAVIDTSFLASLSKRNFVAGCSEIIKHSLIKDKDLFELLTITEINSLLAKNELLSSIISCSCKIKLAVVEQDEKEQNYRAILNFGHSLAHLIETYTNYKSYLHGEAVLAGMGFAVWWSQKYLGLSSTEFQKIENFLVNQNVTVNLNKIDEKTFCSILANDKKNYSTGINFIGIKKIGEVKICEKVALQQIWFDFKEYCASKTALISY